jgi:gluconolactonase
MKTPPFSLLLLVLLSSPAQSAPLIERLDPRLDTLLAADAAVEKVADGFTWLEGPAWDRRNGLLLFTDIPANAVYRWSPGAPPSLLLKPSGYTGAVPFSGREPGANGLAFDGDGRLVLCEHGDRRVTRLEDDGSKTVLAARYDGKRLNSPNDVVVAPSGAIYFTDPPFGLPRAFDDQDKELPFSGVYRLANGTLRLLTAALRAPNGLAVGPGETTLYVSNADRAHPVWMAFPLRGDRPLGDGRVLADATAWLDRGPGAPDGMEVDAAGHLFGAGPGGLYILAPDGALLGRVHLGGATSNAAWGEDGSVLYITASTAVYRLQTRTRGVGW